MHQLAAVVLAWMVSLQPLAVTPWRDRFPEVAEAIADVSAEAPLYRGERGVERTAALLTAMAWHESRFDVGAVGDKGASVCLLQLGVSNLRALGVTRDELLGDARACLRAAVRMVVISFGVCRARPPQDRLAHFAAGGGGCGEKGTRESRHRFALAAKLLRERPAE